MPALHELQAAFRRAIVADDIGGLVAFVHDHGLDPALRLQVYRNNTFISLTEALAATYPVVCRLVARRFFDFAATAYIRENLPDRPCLFEYGASFPDFLAAFRPAADLAYLPDVARLEWAFNVVRNAPPAAPLAAGALFAAAQAHGAALLAEFDPAVRYLASEWAVDAIWRTNQELESAEQSFAGPVRLEIRRTPDGIVCRRLDAPTWGLRARLQAGVRLDAAAEAALAEAPQLDLAGALRALAVEHLLVGITPLQENAP